MSGRRGRLQPSLRPRTGSFLEPLPLLGDTRPPAQWGDAQERRRVSEGTAGPCLLCPSSAPAWTRLGFRVALPGTSFPLRQVPESGDPPSWGGIRWAVGMAQEKENQDPVGSILIQVGNGPLESLSSQNPSERARPSRAYPLTLTHLKRRFSDCLQHHVKELSSVPT